MIWVNTEALDDAPTNSGKNTKTLMILPSAHHDERRQCLVVLHPDRIPSSQMEPELQKIAQIKPKNGMMWSRIFQALKA